MARLSGVDLPRDKRVEVALTYIYGIGRTRAQQVCDGTGIDGVDRCCRRSHTTCDRDTSSSGTERHT